MTGRHAPAAPPDGLPETAGTHMVSAIARAHVDDRVADVLERLRGTTLDYAGAIYIVDASGRPAGVVPGTTLLVSAIHRTMGELSQPAPAAVTRDMDQEHAATIGIRHRVSAVPVVDDDGRLVGVLPPESLMEVLRTEHLEDIHRLAGVRRDQDTARWAIEAPPLRRARNRLPWLLIGLAGSAVATAVMAGFEATLEATVAVGFFVPGIVYMADAIGTQTEAAAVRALSLVHEPIARLVWGELRTGLLMGATLAAIALPGVWMTFGDLPLAIAVASALLAAGAVATTIGLMLPWLLWRSGRDPAYGAGPLATVIQDVLSILIYLSVVSLLIR